MSTLTYLKTLFRDYRVASVTPTSSFGVRWICSKIDFERARCIVEFGPGTGVITEAMVRRMRPDARLILIELNASFVGILKAKLRDPRIAIHHTDARDVRRVVAGEGLDGIDYLVTGIPFSYLAPLVREDIVEETADLIRDGGKFLAYQTIWQQDSHLLDYLVRRFDHTSSTIELRNAPPLRLYQARKEDRSGGQVRSGN